MQRRKFLVGMGSLAAGTSAVLGTAATTTYNLNDRKIGADIVADSNAVIKLVDDTPENDIVTYEGGELEIDFSNGNGQGVNVGSVVEIGNVDNPSPGGTDPDRAFWIENNATAPLDLEVDFEAGPNYNSDASTMAFGAAFDGRSPIKRTVGPGLSSGDVKKLYDQDDFGPPKLKPNVRVFFALRIDADKSGSNTNENLSGDLEITATQPASDN